MRNALVPLLACKQCSISRLASRKPIFHGWWQCVLFWHAISYIAPKTDAGEALTYGLSYERAQTLEINPEKTDIDSFTFDDFKLIGYKAHKKIEMKMAV
jgi:hypothetical protein